MLVFEKKKKIIITKNYIESRSILFSLLHGNKKEDKMDLSFCNVFIMVIIFEVILKVILLIFPDVFLKVFGVTETTYNMAKTYYTIVSLGCIFSGVNIYFL